MNSNKYIEVISKLNRLTQENKLKWARYEIPKTLSTGTDDIIHEFIGTRYKESFMGLYVRNYRKYDPDQDRVYWDDILTLAMFDGDLNEQWQFPTQSGLYELYESAKYQIADVDGFIDSVLSEDD